jgi:hypothetical protein
MTNRRSPRLLLSGIAAGMLFAITGAAAFSAPPSPSPGAADVAAEPSAISITVRTCPPGYDPAADGADYRRDCHEQAGDTNFVVRSGGNQGPSASTGTSGDAPQESTVSFSGLTPARYTITAEAPAEIAGAFVGSCESNLRTFEDYPFVPFAIVGMYGYVALELKAGETMACDWYQVMAT